VEQISTRCAVWESCQLGLTLIEDASLMYA
jgi:hypothetical protein